MLVGPDGRELGFSPEKMLYQILEEVQKLEGVIGMMQQSALMQEMKVNFLIRKLMDNSVLSEEQLNTEWPVFRDGELAKLRAKQEEIKSQIEQINEEVSPINVQL